MYDEMLSAMARRPSGRSEPGPEVPRRDNSANWPIGRSTCRGRIGHPVPALADGAEWCHRHRPQMSHQPHCCGEMSGSRTGLRRRLSDPCRAGLGHDHDRRPRARPGLVHQPRPHHAPTLRPADRGLPGPPATVARFEELMWAPVRDLEWYETLAMVRSTAIMTRISVLRQDAGKPLLAPARRQSHPRPLARAGSHDGANARADDGGRLVRLRG